MAARYIRMMEAMAKRISPENHQAFLASGYVMDPSTAADKIMDVVYTKPAQTKEPLAMPTGGSIEGLMAYVRKKETPKQE